MTVNAFRCSELHANPWQTWATGVGSAQCHSGAHRVREKQMQARGSDSQARTPQRPRALGEHPLSTLLLCPAVSSHGGEALKADGGQGEGPDGIQGLLSRVCAPWQPLHAHLSDSATSSQSKMQAGPPDREWVSDEGRARAARGAEHASCNQATSRPIPLQVPAVWARARHLLRLRTSLLRCGKGTGRPQQGRQVLPSLLLESGRENQPLPQPSAGLLCDFLTFGAFDFF